MEKKQLTARKKAENCAAHWAQSDCNHVNSRPIYFSNSLDHTRFMSTTKELAQMQRNGTASVLLPHEHPEASFNSRCFSSVLWHQGKKQPQSPPQGFLGLPSYSSSTKMRGSALAF